MDAFLIRLEAQLQQILLEQKEIRQDIISLREENSILRNELLGLTANAQNSNQDCLGLIEKTTVREILEEMSFKVGRIESVVIELQSNMDNKQQWETTFSNNDCNFASTKNKSNVANVFEECRIIEIRSRTDAEEKQFLRSLMKKHRENERMSPIAGTSIQSRTPQDTLALHFSHSSSSIFVLRNWLTVDLASFYYYTLPNFGEFISGPLNVNSLTSEAYIFHGVKETCAVHCTWQVREDLFLTVTAATHFKGKIALGVRFSREGEGLADSEIFTSETIGPCTSDFYLNYSYNEQQKEVFSIYENLVATARMTVGPHALVEVEIMDIDFSNLVDTCKTIDLRKIERRLNFQGVLGKDVTCKVQITNALPVSLIAAGRFVGPYNDVKHLPETISSCTQTDFFIVTENQIAEAVFHYKLESTDLGIAIAIRTEGNQNSFAFTFTGEAVVVDRKLLKALVGPTAWRSFQHRKFVFAVDGEKMIENRNIRVYATMTTDAKPDLQVRIEAV